MSVEDEEIKMLLDMSFDKGDNMIKKFDRIEGRCIEKIYGQDRFGDCATDAYQYYNRIIIKDFAGNTILEEIGCLNRSANGGWWLS